MAAKVTITATAAKGLPLTALANAIEMRRKQLGETTSEAVIATAINVFSSLRARTRIANAKRVVGYAVKPTGYVAGWYTEGGKRRRCVRAGKRGGRVTGRIRWMCERNARDSELSVFRVVEAEGEGKSAKRIEYFAVAKSAAEVEKQCAEAKQKRIRKFRGLARTAIGLIQSDISKRGVPKVANAGTLAATKAAQVYKVAVNESGWNMGRVSLTAHDALRYATNALRGGEGDVTLALKKAANRTIGIINNYVKRNIDPARPKIPSPFPEVKGRRK